MFFGLRKLCREISEFFSAFSRSLRVFCATIVRKDANELPACNEEVQIEENGPLHRPSGAKTIAAREHLQQQGDAKHAGRSLREGNSACMRL